MAEESERGSALTADQVGLPGAQSTFLGRGSGFGEGGDGTFCPTWMVLRLPGFLLQKKETPEPAGVWCWARLPPSVSGLVQQSTGGRRRLQTRLCEHVCCPGRQTVSCGFGVCGGEHKRCFHLNFRLGQPGFTASSTLSKEALPLWTGCSHNGCQFQLQRPSLEKLCQV